MIAPVYVKDYIFCKRAWARLMMVWDCCWPDNRVAANKL